MSDLWTDRLDKTSLTPAHKRRLLASQEKFLGEVKPSQSQIEHGLALHYESFVGDAQGSIPACTPGAINAQRLDQELADLDAQLQRQGLDQAARIKQLNMHLCRRKPAEAAFDREYHQWRADLFKLAGVDVAVEDITGPQHNAFEDALRRLAEVNLAYDQQDSVRPLRRAADVDAVDGTARVIQHMSGVGGFAEAPKPRERLDLFFGLGVRASQLTYIQDNRLCSSWLQGESDQGLTPLGRQIVARMNELGMAVDIAHCGLRSAFDVLQASDEPVLLSHTGCSALYDERKSGYVDLVFKQPYAQGVSRPACPPGPRNATDDLLRELGRRSGLVCLYNIAEMLAAGEEGWRFDCFARHIEHAVSVAGVNHVGIGSDRTYFGFQWDPHPCEWTNWPYYTVGLVCRGFSDDDILKIIGGNLRRYLRRVMDKQPWTDLFVPCAEDQK